MTKDTHLKERTGKSNESVTQSSNDNGPLYNRVNRQRLKNNSVQYIKLYIMFHRNLSINQ